MNDMRRLIEAVEQLDDGVSQDQRDQAAMNTREYAAFKYGIEKGNEMQYEFGGYGGEDEIRKMYNHWVETGRKGLYEETVVENIGSSQNVGGPYTAAELYLGSERGTTLTQMAKQLSERTAIDYHIAVLMIDAIDAYEDIRETFVKEDKDEFVAKLEGTLEEQIKEAFINGYWYTLKSQGNDWGTDETAEKLYRYWREDQKDKGIIQ